MLINVGMERARMCRVGMYMHILMLKCVGPAFNNNIITCRNWALLHRHVEVHVHN